MKEPDLVIPVAPPTDQRRKNIAERKAFLEHAVAAAREQKVRPPDPPVIVLYRVTYADRRRRDPDNHSKLVLDACYGRKGIRRDVDDHGCRVWCINSGFGPWTGEPKTEVYFEHPAGGIDWLSGLFDTEAAAGGA